MKLRSIVCLGAVALCGAAFAADVAATGQKLDSGLGELPHYSQWLDKSGRHPTGLRVAGESLDSGLGSLPHYRLWKDKSGRDPMGLQATRVAGVAGAAPAR